MFRLNSEYFFNHLFPEAKYFREFFSDDRQHDPAHGVEREGIMDHVGHFNAPGNLPEEVLVVPESVRTDALLIDEEFMFFNLADLGDPGYGDPKHGPDYVSDDLPGVHLRPGIGGDLKSHGRRGDLLKVPRVGKECPAGIQIGRNKNGRF